MGDYDISKAFERIEDELLSSMIRNMKRHKVEEVKEDKQWSMWQAEQLKSLEKYKVQNRETFGSTFGSMNKSMGEMIRASKQEGGMKQEVRIMQAIKKGFKVSGKNVSGSPSTSANFFQLNEKKLDTLIKATTSDMQKAETAILRRANDQYRKVIYSAQVYANTGAGTYAKAVDMATKDMLSAGLNCVEYANGARHTAADYADMAIKTANKRAYLMGEGEKRKEWGIHTVIINKRGNPCPKCLPFVGKVFIDDVWSGGSAADGDYPLLSQAISMGLYHPRCKDSHNTYFPGISPEPEEKFTKQEMDDIEQGYKEEQKRNYAAKQAEKFGRLSKYSLDDENKKKYKRKNFEWNNIVESIEKSGYNSSVKEYRTTMYDEKRVPIRQAIQLHKVINDLPVKVKYALKGIEFKLDSKIGSGYKPFEKTVYLAENASRKEILHEIGHVIEDELLDKNAVDVLKRQYTKGLTIKNVISVNARDSSGNVKKIFILKNDKFISDYQGRLYIKNKEEAFNTNGDIRIEELEEFISEAFSYFDAFPSVMKKHHLELYNLIESGVENG